METNKNPEDLFKRNMKLDAKEIPELDKEVLDKLRNKVAQRKKTEREKISFGNAVIALLNFKLKFYQVALLLIVVISFFVFKPDGKRDPVKENEILVDSGYSDSLESVSVKDSRFLIRNFAVAVN
ncbi:MAG: hypothetical protein IAF38_22275 [Bacteroidia bacterium]|nr:hypothetical protein [Bacteroidia bacterium]